ncbi:MAG: aldehyde dehydrogenase family protein [Polyangiales bacterium]
MTVQAASASSTSGSEPRTALSEIPALVRGCRDAFDAGRTRPVEWRKAQLAGVVRLIREHEDEILAALHADLGKPRLEAFAAELATTKHEAEFLLKNVAEWMKPERVPTPMTIQPGRSEIRRDPLGVVLVIAPWNYPFQLAVVPMLGALAAGNAVVLKPSEVAPATSSLLARMLPRYLDPSAVKVVEGGVQETTAVLDQCFDHIFYTGNGVVGRIVMAAAAKNLTPVTLELGGKSPTYVDASADLDVAAKRISSGKWWNCGQTCIAPDYVLAHERIHDALVEKLRNKVTEFYGADPKKSPDYARIVNTRHLARLEKLLGSGETVCGGQLDPSERYLAPTILKGVAADSPVMQDEIFGPILPVLKVKGHEEAIRFVNARPKPLALYCFTGDGSVSDAFLERTSSGGVCVNHVVLHFMVPDLPFGGVGESGMGAYHGRRTFEVFTHHKAVLHKPTFLEPTITYPPFSETKLKLIKAAL